MSQNQKRNIKKAAIVFFMMSVLTTSFSCAKKASGIREPIKKTESINLNQMVSNQADQQASSQNLLYKIATLETPRLSEDSSTAQVKLELLTPDSQYLPVTTSHQAGSLDSQGIYQDAARSAQVYVQARCSANGCSKYLLLVTVVKNNRMVYQSAALSYQNDCKFYAVSTVQSTGFYSNLDQLESATQSIQPKNDCSQSSSDF